MQQVQSENEKMVPIDTSGESVEVELKDEKEKEQEQNTKQESNEIVVEQESETKKVESDELDQYSESVKKRIDKLTKKMREAERREQAAIEFAEKMKKQNENYEKKVKDLDTGYTNEFKERVNTQSEVIKDNLKRALASKDNDGVVKAQEQLAQIAIEQQRLKEAEKLLTERQDNVEKEKGFFEKNPESRPQYKKPDPRAEQWAEDNEWFGKDEVMTYAAFGIHKRLVEQELLDPSSEEYYSELDKRIKKEFPHKFEDKSKPTQKVASAVRTSPSGRRTVKLTPSQVAIAKKLGVPLEEYAKHVKEA